MRTLYLLVIGILLCAHGLVVPGVIALLVGLFSSAGAELICSLGLAVFLFMTPGWLLGGLLGVILGLFGGTVNVLDLLINGRRL